MAMKGSGSWHRWQKDIKTDILTELLFIDNDRIYIGGPITDDYCNILGQRGCRSKGLWPFKGAEARSRGAHRKGRNGGNFILTQRRRGRRV